MDTIEMRQYLLICNSHNPPRCSSLKYLQHDSLDLASMMATLAYRLRLTRTHAAQFKFFLQTYRPSSFVCLTGTKVEPVQNESILNIIVRS